MNEFRLTLACWINRSAVITLKAWTFLDFVPKGGGGTGITTHSERLTGDV